MGQFALYISQSSIDHGIAGSCGQCPIALEAKRFFTSHVTEDIFVAIAVDLDCLEVVLREKTYPYKRFVIFFALDLDAVDFIRDFDHGNAPEPQVVHFEVPETFYRERDGGQWV